jgi:hypothetical protein
MNIKSLQKYAFALAVGVAAMAAQAADEMLPFALASNDAGKIADKLDATKTALTNNGFTIAGEYTPFEGAHIIVVTNDELKAAAATPRGGYVAAQRVSLTEMGGKVQVSYTNPGYMAAAYRIAPAKVAKTAAALKAALGYVQNFGPAKGKTEKEMNKYHYTFGMEYFDEPLELATRSSYQDAVATVEKNLDAKVGGTSKIYRIDIPGANQTIFGVGMADKGNKYRDDKFIMSEIDFKPLRSTAHLPYEILVNGKEVEALHARFRIAINFTDLSMMGSNSFMNIMPTPDAINEVLTKVAGGKAKSDF